MHVFVVTNLLATFSCYKWYFCVFLCKSF